MSGYFCKYGSNNLANIFLPQFSTDSSNVTVSVLCLVSWWMLSGSFLFITVATDKTLLFFFQPKIIDSFLISPRNYILGYSIEVPHQGASNEYQNLCFHEEIRKKIK